MSFKEVFNGKIGVISPSDCVSLNSNKVRNAVSFLKERYLEPVFGKHINSSSPIERARDINEMFANKDVSGIFCLKGGFKSIELLEYIDYGIIKENKKFFGGFSDISILFNAIFKMTGLRTYHTFLIGRYPTRFTEKALLNGLRGGVVPHFSEWRSINDSSAEGVLVGGNSDSIKHLIGTPYEPVWDGRILLLEFFDNSLEELDRTLSYFRLCGVFDKINGLIIGKFVNNEGISQDEVFERYFNFFKNYDFPVLFDVDVGHVDNQITLPIGGRVKIDSMKREITIL